MTLLVSGITLGVVAHLSDPEGPDGFGELAPPVRQEHSEGAKVGDNMSQKGVAHGDGGVISGGHQNGVF